MASVNSLRFECPVCYELIFPPIYQCCHGHLVCQDCVTKCKNCPTCRVPMTGRTGRSRNLELEKLIREQVYLCPHEGCQETRLKTDEYTEHKKNCVYRKAEFCSLLKIDGGNDECKEEMTLNDLVDHLFDSHPERMGIGEVVSSDSITFEAIFEPNFRGTHAFVCWVTGQKNEMEKFPIVLLEKWERGFVTWSPIILGSPALVGRFVCDISIRPGNSGSATLGPDAPLLRFKGIIPHCPEDGASSWNSKGDFCTKIDHLKELVKACTDDRKWYKIKARLFVKSEGCYYQFQFLDDDEEDNNNATRSGHSSLTARREPRPVPTRHSASMGRHGRSSARRGRPF